MPYGHLFFYSTQVFIGSYVLVWFLVPPQQLSSWEEILFRILHKVLGHENITNLREIDNDNW
jgi:hypothetical protein